MLRERGLRLLYDEPRRGTADSRINFVHPKDAGGVLVELVEPRRERSHTRVTAWLPISRFRAPNRADQTQEPP